MTFKQKNIVEHNFQVRHPRCVVQNYKYRGADKSLARPGRKQDTATEDYVHISYL